MRKLADVLREHGQRLGEATFLSYDVVRDDKSFYETREIAEVLADDNVPDKAIRMLSIELHKVAPETEEATTPRSERKPSAYIAFSRFSDDKIVFFTASQNRDWCFLLADELDGQVGRILKGRVFRFLPRHSIDIFLISLVAACLLMWASWTTFHSMQPPLRMQQIVAMSPDQRSIEMLKILSWKRGASDYSAPIMMLFLAVTIALIEIRPLSRLLDKASRSVFYWGDMVGIHDRYQKKAQLVKWGIIVAFAVSLLASITATHIKW